MSVISAALDKAPNIMLDLLSTRTALRLGPGITASQCAELHESVKTYRNSPEAADRFMPAPPHRQDVMPPLVPDVAAVTPECLHAVPLALAFARQVLTNNGIASYANNRITPRYLFDISFHNPAYPCGANGPIRSSFLLVASSFYSAIQVCRMQPTWGSAPISNCR